MNDPRPTDQPSAPVHRRAVDIPGVTVQPRSADEAAQAGIPAVEAAQ